MHAETEISFWQIFSSLLAPEIVKMITYSENNDVNLIKITFPFGATYKRGWSECRIYEYMSMVSCQKGPTRHAYAWQIGPFCQDTLDVRVPVICLSTSPSTWLLHEYEYTYTYWLMSISTSMTTGHIMTILAFLVSENDMLSFF